MAGAPSWLWASHVPFRHGKRALRICELTLRRLRSRPRAQKLRLPRKRSRSRGGRDGRNSRSSERRRQNGPGCSDVRRHRRAGLRRTCCVRHISGGGRVRRVRRRLRPSGGGCVWRAGGGRVRQYTPTQTHRTQGNRQVHEKLMSVTAMPAFVAKSSRSCSSRAG